MLDAERFDMSPKVRSRKLNILPSNPETYDESKVVGPGRFPSWLHRKLPKGSGLSKTSQSISHNRLHTVCEEAKCPNLLECWSKKTATFLVMGKECTRACGFCDIAHAKQPAALEADEPQRVANSVLSLGLKHVVITMVARDDLPDGGAAHLVAIVDEVRKTVSSATIELLTSDFEGNDQALDTVFTCRPEIFNHNIETVRALTPRVRHKATYDRTLSVLKRAKESGLRVKSGIMVGLGETKEQVFETIADLKNVGCDIITIGQYLQASRHKLLVKSFVTPEQFKLYENYGQELGVLFMYCGPFVRSSYNADMIIEKANG